MVQHKYGGVDMLYEDKNGNLFMPEEVEELPIWEIEDMGIHVFEEGEV